MADQEFLASFAVEIDDTGVERLQSVLSQNREMAEQLAAAFDTARDAVSGFFDQLSAASLATGEMSPYQRLLDLAAEPLNFTLDLVTEEAEGKLEAFLQQAQQLFEGTKLPLNADNSPALSVADETVGILLSLFDSTFLPLNGNPENVLSVGNAALDELMQRFSSTFLPLMADASAVLSAGQAALQQLQNLYSSTTLTVYVQEVSSSGATPSESSADSSESKPSAEPSGSAAPVSKPSEGTSGSTSGSANPAGKSSSGVSLSSMMRAATGGRFSNPTKAEIAEDGDPEYVIPVKKESIAVPLLRQLMGELSDSAREMLRNDFSGPTLSGLPELFAAAPAAAAPVITQNMNQSVQVPVSIQVTAAGSDPEAVGRSIYDVTEQYLLRTLRSAV